MTPGLPLEVAGLTKRFGEVHAVDNLTFAVRPGVVTGFLGPNGAGKTTTLRCLLGLVRPDAGSVRIGGRSYAEIEHPMRVVGAALEAASFHPGRTARAHLRYLAQATSMPTDRVEEVLRLVGIEQYADRRVGGYSLGMRQRLGLAQALLGDPPVLVLDEPANGLDPAGIAWLRGFLRALAAEGRTVVISSHVLSEVQQTVEEVVVLNKGRLVTQGRLSDLEAGRARVLVRTADRDRLAAALSEADGMAVEPVDSDGLRVSGGTAVEVGRVAFAAGVQLHHLADEPGDLERLFLDLTTEVAS